MDHPVILKVRIVTAKCYTGTVGQYQWKTVLNYLEAGAEDDPGFRSNGVESFVLPMKK